MEQIERRVQRRARAMTRPEVIIKAIAGELSWFKRRRCWESQRGTCAESAEGMSAGGCRQ